MMFVRSLHQCLLSLLPVTLIFVYLAVGCSDAGKASEANTGDTSTITTTPTPAPPTDTIHAAALEYCNCIRQTMGRFDPTTEALILQSAEQPDPLLYLQKELEKMDSPAAREQAAKDLQTFGNIDAATPCISAVSRKYGIDETAPLTRQQLTGALQKFPDCKLVTALFKVAYSESARQSP